MRILGFTGVVGVGKDYVAERMNAHIHSMAQGLYSLSERVLGLGKEARYGPQGPALRLWWQTVGQWGRGEDVPLTKELLEAFPGMPQSREAFAERYRELLWPGFGESANYWLAETDRRVSHAALLHDGVHVVTNVRFRNEAWAFRELWHITAPAAEIAARQAQQKISPTALNDVSEHFALEIESMLREIENRTVPTPSVQDWFIDNGFVNHTRVVWNSQSPRPNPEYHVITEL